jgi:glycolate oxidase FAD binding subunit
VGSDGVLEQLQRICEDRAHEARSTEAIAGVMPRYVAEPASTGETAGVLRVARDRGLRVVARGGGTKQHWGMPPEQVDVVVETHGLAGLSEHASGDLIAVTGAGTRMVDLQDTLAKADQQLALDDAFNGSTIGGAVATATSGPRRLLYGTMRDLLIGITFVRADGVVARSGGRVVKNVAGYDFGKLLTGSYGTLGVVTEVVVRLHPVPKVRRWVLGSLPDAAAAARVATEVLASQVVASAVEVDQPVDGDVNVAVLLEGVEAGVAARVEEARRMVGPSADVSESAPDWFGCYPFGPGDVGLKVSSTITGLASVMARARQLVMPVRGSMAGVLYAAGPTGLGVSELSASVDQMRAVSQVASGHTVVLTAPPGVRDDLDLWGPVPGIDLMRRLKEQLDPGRLLAPGRFVGGI